MLQGKFVQELEIRTMLEREAKYVSSDSIDKPISIPTLRKCFSSHELYLIPRRQIIGKDYYVDSESFELIKSGLTIKHTLDERYLFRVKYRIEESETYSVYREIEVYGDGTALETLNSPVLWTNPILAFAKKKVLRSTAYGLPKLSEMGLRNFVVSNVDRTYYQVEYADPTKMRGSGFRFVVLALDNIRGWTDCSKFVEFNEIEVEIVDWSENWKDLSNRAHLALVQAGYKIDHRSKYEKICSYSGCI